MSSVLSLNLGGRLVTLERPLVMGILNATPDSFYAPSRVGDGASAVARAEAMLAEGADLIDVGGCSTRPGGLECDGAEELRRLREALAAVRSVAADVPVSVDTFRADVARMAVEEYGVCLVNDVTCGRGDRDMFRTVARLRVGYVLTHNASERRVRPEEVLTTLVRRADQLHAMGVADVVLDPGIGFTASRDDDFALLRRLADFSEAQMPLLVGLSRKRLVWETLGTSPAESLGGTTALNMFALSQGANILRVHDVRAAREAVDLFCRLGTSGGMSQGQQQTAP